MTTDAHMTKKEYVVVYVRGERIEELAEMTEENISPRPGGVYIDASRNKQRR